MDISTVAVFAVIITTIIIITTRLIVLIEDTLGFVALESLTKIPRQSMRKAEMK